MFVTLIIHNYIYIYYVAITLNKKRKWGISANCEYATNLIVKNHQNVEI